MTTSRAEWPDKDDQRDFSKYQAGVPTVAIGTLHSKPGANIMYLSVPTMRYMGDIDSIEVKIDPARSRMTITPQGQYPLWSKPPKLGHRYVGVKDVAFMKRGQYVAVKGEPNVYEWRRESITRG